MKSDSNYQFADAEEWVYHPFFKKCASDLLPVGKYKRIADIGCGNGILCRHLKDVGHDVIGFEPGIQGFKIATETHKDIQFFQLGVDDDPPLGLELVDGIISTEVVEHLFSPRNLPNFCKKILKPGGCVVVTTPYHGWLKNTAISMLGKWDAHHNPLWDYGHIKFWSPKSLRHLFEEQGFIFDSFRGYGRFPGMWKTMMLSFRLPK